MITHDGYLPFCSLFNQNGEKDAGEIGLLIIVSGMIGSVVCGIVLDRTHEFKWAVFNFPFFIFYYIYYMHI